MQYDKGGVNFYQFLINVYEIKTNIDLLHSTVFQQTISVF
jgi:hypothetical protein